tara:strand:- start:1749 stop:2195 length:447 start_codon:yes stop_codon:yes gene_type:complete
MAHFAEINDENTVLRVLVVTDSDCADENGDESEAVGEAFCQQVAKSTNRWIQTSYNTVNGEHINGGASFRQHFAGVGMLYSEEHDAFHWPSPFKGAVLDTDTFQWLHPTPMPQDGKPYDWDEETEKWVEREMTAEEIKDAEELASDEE